MSPRPLTISTAGHIDHGKSALVGALTGKDTDRLPEEKRRGISIELGYAHLVLGERSMSIVDVPGHERFVRTMIAGATGVDIFLMVIDAREGIMPQTREHLLILRSLGITAGVCALTKCDLAEPDRLGKVKAEAADLMPGIPIISTSAKTGAGIEELKLALSEAGGRLDRNRTDAPELNRAAVLHIDRVFSLKGHGTIVTGTSSSDCFRQGDTALLLPSEQSVRLRSIQVHDSEVDIAEPNQRVALNLAGIGRSDVKRGDVITTETGVLVATFRFDASIWPINVARDLNGERVRVHHGTREAPARLIDLKDTGLAQLRLDQPLLTRPGDRFVLRRISSHETVGGGEILDDLARRHGPDPTVDWVRVIRDGTPDEVLEFMLNRRFQIPIELESWLSGASLRPAFFRHPVSEWGSALARLANAGEEAGVGDVQSTPLETENPGPNDETAHLSNTESHPDPRLLEAFDLLSIDALKPRSIPAMAESLGVTLDEVVDLLDTLANCDRVAKVKPGVYFHGESLNAAEARVIQMAQEHGSISVSELRDELGTGRKHAQAVLEHCDRNKITYRRGDRRHLY